MADPPFADSLCHRCIHVRIVAAARTTFLMCKEPSLNKYAPQPVRACPKYVKDPSTNKFKRG